jgi:hypothetical protein
VRITHEWVERSASKPPEAPEPVYPSDGGQAEGTDFAFRWNAAKDADGDKITDYHFVLANRQDMRWPLSTNFDKLISRTADKGKAQYTLPSAGLLTGGIFMIAFGGPKEIAPAATVSADARKVSLSISF